MNTLSDENIVPPQNSEKVSLSLTLIDKNGDMDYIPLKYVTGLRFCSSSEILTIYGVNGVVRATEKCSKKDAEKRMNELDIFMYYNSRFFCKK